MVTFEDAWKATHQVEGGYVNNPADPGGETNHGITIAVARANGYTGAMRDLSPDQAAAIAKSEFWDRLRLDRVAAISGRVALEVFDTNLNFYSGAAVHFLQRSLNALNEGARWPPVALDGQLGDSTLAALRAYFSWRGVDAEVVLLRCLNGLQLADYVRQVEAQPGKRQFFFGWVRARVVI